MKLEDVKQLSPLEQAVLLLLEGMYTELKAIRQLLQEEDTI